MNDVILSPSLRSRINSAKDLPCDGQMLHFVQHDNPSNNLRENTNLSSRGLLCPTVLTASPQIPSYILSNGNDE